MPIRIDNDLPVKKVLEQENIFVMDEHRDMTQESDAVKGRYGDAASAQPVKHTTAGKYLLYPHDVL